MSSNLNFLLELIFLQKKKKGLPGILSKLLAWWLVPSANWKWLKQSSRSQGSQTLGRFLSLPRWPGGTRCTHLKEAGTPLPGLLWIFTASAQVLSWIQQLKEHSLSTYYVPVPHDRDANKAGAFNSRAQEQLLKWMTSAIITAVPLCERHEPSVMGTQGVGLEGGSQDGECKDS